MTGLVIAALAIVAAAYQALVLIAAWRHLKRRAPPASGQEPVSILKPVLGRDPHFYEAIRSHAVQEYPEFEILFGVADLEDPAVPDIRRLMEEFPEKPIRLVLCSTRAPNGKVGVLVDLAAQARHPLLVVNDSDIRVPADYLRRTVAELQEPGAGLVTCLYSAAADYLPGRFEAIGIATDFAPGVLAAPCVGVREFGLGSTLLLRAADLRRIGGFEALTDYLADDYQLGRRISSLGLNVVLSKVVVETYLSGRTWGEVWAHQVRWARTIRLSRPGGYYGLPLTQATLWSIVAAFDGQVWTAAVLFGLRLAAGLMTGAVVLGSTQVASRFYLVPLRDLWGAGVWVCGLFGDTVLWRGKRLRLSRDGRIRDLSPLPGPLG